MSIRPCTVEVMGTPEAGKTTTIKEVISSLENQGYQVQYVRESAETLPDAFTKGSIDAHIWMRLETAQSFLLPHASDADIIIIDRGIVDTLFWDYLFFLQNKLSKKQLDSTDNFFKSLGYLPDFVIILTTSPEEAIIRRGGEGRIVTKEFIEQYNNALETFCEKSIPVPNQKIDTTDVPVHSVVKEVETIILRKMTSE